MAHHEPLKALGPIDWDDVAQGDLQPFLTNTFAQAQTVIDSIPAPPSQATNKPAQNTRARSRTESAILPGPASDRTTREHTATTAAATEAAAHAALLQKEWKEVKVPPKDNPLNIAVYKLSAKDGRGAWFARRSVHTGVPFAKFRLGLAREFGETMRNSTGGVGTGNVRGIGAERCAERAECAGVGSAEVWVLSAQFPGPTTPRDFVTLLLTGDEAGANGKGPRQYVVVSKPCGHAECAPRAGYIRGSYESVEIIREVPVDAQMRRTRSSTDLQREAHGEAGRRPVRESEQTLPHSVTELPPQQETETEMAVEWVMVTRSDPGGSVPRFMVEKGTPGGIVNDAGRFLKWLETKDADNFDGPEEQDVREEGAEGEPKPTLPPRPGQSVPDLPVRAKFAQTTTVVDDDVPPSGLYSMITGLVGGAASAVASHLPHISYLSGQDTDPNSPDESDTDSDSGRSFASAAEPAAPVDDPITSSKVGGGDDVASLHSNKSDGSSAKPNSTAASQHEKQLKKLQERYRKLEEKTAKQQEKTLQSSKQNHGDVDALAKLKEKHEREIARQEENFRKEVKKLEEKRVKEEKKAEERKKKELEKEARGNLAMELERTKVERDMALKQIDILKEQVGDLQSQNTKLVAKLGRLGGLTKPEEVLGNGIEGA